MKRWSLISLSFMLLFSMGCASLGTKSQAKLGQHPYTLHKVIKKTITADYLLFLPADYGKTDKKWPLIFFLHGAGERGDDVTLVTKHGPPKIVQENPNCEFIVLSPQCPNGIFWQNEVLINLLDEIVSKYSIDEDRIYLTGLSMGGYGTWSLAAEYPNRFAAIAPICGGGDARRIARAVEKLPIWVFHGAKDNVVPIAESERIVEALKAHGAEVRFTVYPDAEHDSWTETYNNPELYDWFLSHRRVQQ